MFPPPSRPLRPFSNAQASTASSSSSPVPRSQQTHTPSSSMNLGANARSSSSTSSNHIHPDDAIRQTDDDAASSRASATALGYLVDPFSNLLYKSHMIPGHGPGSGAVNGSRKPPLINVGTHHRTVGIDTIVEQFLAAHDGLNEDVDDHSLTESAHQGVHGGDVEVEARERVRQGEADGTPRRKRGGVQIVSLGAGSDTRFWRLMSRANHPNIFKYVEIDFPHLTSPKAQRIARSKKLHSILSPGEEHQGRPTSGSASSSSARQIPSLAASNDNSTTNGLGSYPSSSSLPYKVSQGGTRLDSQLYTLLPLDLRPTESTTTPTSKADLNAIAPDPTTGTATGPIPPTTISSILDAHLLPLLNPKLPTLILAECLFPYMPPGDSQAIISWFGQRFQQCTGVVYEMCGLDDGFGRVMKRNLASRNLSIPGSTFPTPQSQADRFLDPVLGSGVFDHAGAKTLWQVREEIIPPAELQRISKLEILDEIEELKLVLDHYVIAWGTKGRLMNGIGL